MYVPETTTVTVRHFGIGGRADDGCIPETVMDLMAALQSALSDIPPEYQASARVDVHEDPDPYDDMGYEAIRVEYERPMTVEEIATYKAERRARVQDELADYERLASDRRKELASL